VTAHDHAARLCCADEQRTGDAATPLLRAQNVHRFLGSGEARTQILKGVDLSIDRGEYVSIVGASGSGKSTLLYLLGGLDRPDRRDGADQPITPPSAVFIEARTRTS
jgi:ABC-type nitrate/sulfonate/bicarbonate transport system ATPase subunit